MSFIPQSTPSEDDGSVDTTSASSLISHELATLVNVDPHSNWQASSNSNELERYDLSNLSLTPRASTSRMPSGRGTVNTQSRVQGPYTDTAVISVSSGFHPDAVNDKLLTDVILLTSDLVYFYVHKHRLLTASDNYFNFLFPILRQGINVSGSANARAVALAQKTQPGAITPGSDTHPIVSLPESSTVINILLNAVYGKPFAQYAPTFEDLSLSLGTLTRYGISLQRYAAPGTPLLNSLLDLVPDEALPLYILAATHNLYPLAVSVSPYLLSIPLSSITDEIATKLGGYYTKKLFFLHIGRTEALKRLLIQPPRSHPPTFVCDLEEQDNLSRAWTLAGAYIMWDAKADVSVDSMTAVFNNLRDDLSCDICKTSLRMRIRNFASEWSQVKTTI